MFGSILQQAKVTIRSSISEAVDRALVAVPFLIAGGFLTTALAAYLIRSYGLEIGALIVGVLFLVIGLIVGAAVKSTAATSEPELEPSSESTASSGSPSGSAANEQWWSETEMDVVKAAAAAAVPYTVPVLMRLALRNLPLIAAVAAALFVFTRPAGPAEQGPNVAPAE